MSTPRPQFRDLTQQECEALLQRRNHGHLAYAFKNRVDLEPIHYVYDAGWIYGRTAPGSKLTMLQRSPWIAFQVDDVRGTFDWESVVVKGTVYLVGEAATGHAEDLVQEVVAQLRRVVPAAFTEDDPVPDRTVLFRIHADEIEGRGART